MLLSPQPRFKTRFGSVFFQNVNELKRLWAVKGFLQVTFGVRPWCYSLKKIIALL